MLGVGGDGALVGTPGETEATTTRRRSRPPERERDAWAVLASVDGLGPVAFGALLARYESARAVLRDAARPGAVERFAAVPSSEVGPRPHREYPIGPVLARAIVDAVQGEARTIADLRARGVDTITIEEPAYPLRLANVAMPPHVLFVTGDRAALDLDRAVAVVGTRRATADGRHLAARIASALVAAGSSVVSGLAIGIDGAAHEATIRAGGRTVAVIGGGHACLSPAVHVRLAEAIRDAGGAVVSEYPPLVEPSVGTFPRRNRIISGLSDATVVVQAPARSGALITASWALEQGRPAYLVPGRLTDGTYAGCLAFLREFVEAARIVAGIPQLIADLGFADPARVAQAADAVAAAALDRLGRTERLVAGAMLGGPTTVDTIVAETDLPVATVLATLSLLQTRGLVAGANGRYRPAGPLLGEVPMPVLR
jgi:DNA processing protein